jgi:nucleotide-binding universal stress UspA family protein
MAVEVDGTMFDDVLVPTDGSDCANAAIRYAEDLAVRYDATVHVLSVVDSRVLENAPHYEAVREEHVELVEDVAEDVVEDLADTGCDVEHAVRTAVPHAAILRYVRDQDVDLIAMGTHGRTGVERYLLGSVAEKVVRLADVPVLTVPGSDDGATRYPYESVLAPTDGSDGATAAIAPAVDLASTYDARLHALSVVDTAAMGFDVRSATIAESLEEAARDAVREVETQARAASVSTVETTVVQGTPFRGIRSYVDEHDVDLVVMGTRGHTGLERYLLGSVTEKTVRTSSVPVLTVPGHAEADESTEE